MMQAKHLRYAVTAVATAAWLAAAPVALASDAGFLKKAAEGNNLEVALGKVAEHNALNPRVKALGRRLVEDHGHAQTELAAVARAMHKKMPTGVPAHGKTLERELSHLHGAAFDRKYSISMVKDHKKDIAEYVKAEHRVKNAQLKRYIGKTLPVLHAHLKLAEEARASVFGKAHASRAGQAADTATGANAGTGSGSAPGMGAGATTGTAGLGAGGTGTGSNAGAGQTHP